MNIIAFDSHKRYTLASVEDERGVIICEQRIPHDRGNLAGFLAGFRGNGPVAVETVGNWYWIIDEIEGAGKEPKLVHARKAKLMLGMINKTDKLDARGLNKLQRVGTLPTVWIPPGELRDKRELARTRMVFSAQRTRLKNRLHSIIDKYGYQQKLSGFSDIFGAGGRRELEKVIARLPEQTRYVSELLLRQLDEVESKIKALEKRMKEVFKETEQIKLLQSMPGVGFILGVVIALEIGDIERFGSAQKLAGYSGVTPRVHSSGGKTHYGRTRSDTNHYLKWAFSEAGNSVGVNHLCWPKRHVSILYKRIREKKGHNKAIGAVARHLAEATWWMLSQSAAYRDPQYKHVLSTPV